VQKSYTFTKTMDVRQEELSHTSLFNRDFWKQSTLSALRLWGKKKGRMKP